MEEKKKGTFKKIGIPAAIAAIILLLCLTGFFGYKYLNLKGENEKLAEQTAENEYLINELNGQISEGLHYDSDEKYPSNELYFSDDQLKQIAEYLSDNVDLSSLCPKIAEVYDALQSCKNNTAPDETEETDITEEEDASLPDDLIKDEADSSKNKISKTKNASRALKVNVSLNPVPDVDETLKLFWQALSDMPEYRLYLQALNSMPEAQRRLALYSLYSRSLRASAYPVYVPADPNANRSNSSDNSGANSPNVSNHTSVTSSSSSGAGSTGGATDPGTGEPPHEPEGGGPGFIIDEIKTKTLKNTALSATDAEKEQYDKNLLRAGELAFETSDNEHVASKKHTMILYMVASDLEKASDGSCDATEDIAKMLMNFGFGKEYDPDEMNVVICVGAAEGFRNDYMKQYVDGVGASGYGNASNLGGCSVFCVDMDAVKDYWNGKSEPDTIDNNVINEKTLIYLGNFVDNDNSNFCNMVSPATLTAAVDLAYLNFPADEYSLIMWDHGGGITNGFGSQYFDSNDTHGMSVKEVQTALAGTLLYNNDRDNSNSGRAAGGKTEADKKFAFIGFDACMMGGIETASAMIPFTDYYVASGEVSRGGWDYASIAKYISDTFAKVEDDPNKTAEENAAAKDAARKALAEQLVVFYAAQGDHQVDNSCTDAVVACFDLKQIPGMLKQIENISKGLNDLRAKMVEVARDSASTEAEKNEAEQKALNAYFEILHHARAGSYSYGTDEKRRFEEGDASGIGYDFVDVKDFFNKLSDELLKYDFTYSDAVNEIVNGGNGAAGIINNINVLLSNDSAVTKAYANWLGYNNYDEAGGNGALTTLMPVGGSDIGCFTMYMPFMYDADVDAADSEYGKYAVNNYINDGTGAASQYNLLLKYYLKAETEHQDRIRDKIANVIDYNKIFKAQIGYITKTDSEFKEYTDAFAGLGDTAARMGKYSVIVKKEKLASTVIHLAIDGQDAEDYINGSSGIIKDVNVDYGNVTAFEAFRDTVSKISIATTKKASYTVEDGSGGTIVKNADVVVGREDLSLSDISSSAVDIGIEDYARISSYRVYGSAVQYDAAAADTTLDKIDGSKDFASDNIKNTADTVDYSTVFNKQITDSMNDMRSKLVAEINNFNATVDTSAGETLLEPVPTGTDKGWYEAQGRITEWVDGVKGTVSTAVLHFWSPSEETGLYSFAGATAVDKKTENGTDVPDLVTLTLANLRDTQKDVEVDDGSGNITTETKNVVYTVSFYHYVLGGYDNALDPSDINNGTSRYMYVAAADADEFTEGLLVDANALKTSVAIEQPEYLVSNLQIAKECLVSGNSSANDNDAAINAAYQANAANGYAAIIESTSGNATAVTPVYIDEEFASSADNEGIGTTLERPAQSSNNPSGNSQSGRSVDAVSDSNAGALTDNDSGDFNGMPVESDVTPVIETEIIPFPANPVITNETPALPEEKAVIFESAPAGEPSGGDDGNNDNQQSAESGTANDNGGETAGAGAGDAAEEPAA